MRTVVVTPAAAEPVSASEAIMRTHLRTDVDVDDELVDVYIAAARERCEVETRRQFVTATLRLELPRFPRHDRHIELTRPPLQEVVAVRYFDATGTLQTLDESAYIVVGAQPAPVPTPQPMPGRVVLAAGASWPATASRPDAVQIEFRAGYGDPEAVPASLRHAIMVHAADSYVHRETLIVGTGTATLSRTVSDLLGPFWVP